MIRLRVEVSTGHYRVPGQVDTFADAPTFPVAPPATIKGFIESLCGGNPGSFEGEFAYGRNGPPKGFGTLTRRAQVWSTSGTHTKYEVVRPIRVPTYFDLNYCIAVRGPSELRVRDALVGKVSRYGILSLGESGDVVTWLSEEEDSPAQWVVPGRKMTLITKSGRGFKNMTATYGTFDFGPEKAWFGPDGSPS